MAATNIGACPAFLSGWDVEGEGAGGANGGDLFSFTDVQAVNFHFLYGHCFGASLYGGCNDVIRVKNGLFTNTSQISIIGGQLDNAQASCAEFQAQSVMVSNVRIWNCNVGNRSGNNVSVDTPAGTAFGEILLNGNQFCTDSAGDPFTNIPIYLAPGNDWVEAVNNDFHNCTDGILDSSGGAHNVLTPNMGP